MFLLERSTWQFAYVYAHVFQKTSVLIVLSPLYFASWFQALSVPTRLFRVRMIAPEVFVASLMAAWRCPMKADLRTRIKVLWVWPQKDADGYGEGSIFAIFLLFHGILGIACGTISFCIPIWVVPNPLFMSGHCQTYGSGLVIASESARVRGPL